MSLVFRTLTFWFLLYRESSSLTFIEVPKSAAFLIGTTAQMNCSLKCVGDCDGVVWAAKIKRFKGVFRDIYHSSTNRFGVKYQQRDKYAVLPQTNLVIQNITIEDVGQYICKADTHVRAEDIKSAYLTVVDKSTCGSDVVFTEGEKASVTCKSRFHSSVKQRQSPWLNWDIPKSQQIILSNQNDLKVIAKFIVSSAHNRRHFTCRTLWNISRLTSQQVDSCSTPLVVHYGPKHIQVTSNAAAGLTGIQPGEKLMCTAYGNPQPSYRWHRVSGLGGATVVNGPELTVTTSMKGYNTYMCEAKNTLVNKVTKLSQINITFTVVLASVSLNNRPVTMVEMAPIVPLLSFILALAFVSLSVLALLVIMVCQIRTQTKSLRSEKGYMYLKPMNHREGVQHYSTIPAQNNIENSGEEPTSTGGYLTIIA